MPKPAPALPGDAEDENLVAAAAPAKPTGNRVSFRVMKLGADQIFTGDFDRETSQHTKFARNEIVHDVDETIANAHEDRGWVEILGPSDEVRAAEAAAGSKA